MICKLVKKLIPLILCIAGISVWAVDNIESHSRFCIDDSPACRVLAVEISVLELTDKIDLQIEGNQSFNLLCPEDNPNCCPPNLLPVCGQAQEDLILRAKKSYDTSLSILASREIAAGQNSSVDCDFGSPECGVMNDLNCRPGEIWSPVLGCTGGIVDNFPPPPVCGCGAEPNQYGGCSIKMCQTFGGLGADIPCTFFCEAGLGILESDNSFVSMMSQIKDKEESNLGRHMKEQSVQLEAAEQLRKKLKSALITLDEEIKKLNP